MKMKSVHILLSIVLALAGLISPALAAEADWTALGRLLQQAGSAADPDPKILVQALEMRRQLPPTPTTGTPEAAAAAETSSALDAQVTTTAEMLKMGKKYQDALELFQCHLADQMHTPPLLVVGDYCGIAECNIMLGNFAEADKASTSAFLIIDKNRKQFNAKEWDMAVGRLNLYKAFLMLNKRDKQAAAVAKKLSAYRRQ